MAHRGLMTMVEATIAIGGLVLVVQAGILAYIVKIEHRITVVETLLEQLDFGELNRRK